MLSDDEPLKDGGSRTEIIARPPSFNERQGEVSIQVGPSLAASMQDGLKYLTGGATGVS
jgi:hypothetical protein